MGLQQAAEPTPLVKLERRSRAPGLLRDWVSDPGGRVTIALGAFAVAFIVWQIFGWGGPDRRTLISDVAFLPVSVLAALLARRAARNPALDARTRRAWMIVGISFLVYWLGDVIWTLEENVGTGPFPSWADVAYIAFYPLLLWGVLSFPKARRKGADTLKLWLDTGTVMLGAYMILWYFALGPTARQTGSTAFESFVSLAYPVGDLVLIFAMARIMLSQPPRGLGHAMGILATGITLFVVADVAFAHLSLNDAYEGGSWVDSLWMVAQVLMAVAAHYQHWYASRRATDATGEQLRLREFSPLPYVTIFAAFGLLAAVGWREASYPLGGLMLGALGVTTLVVSRQIAALRENLHLLSELHEMANTDVLTGLNSRRHFFEAAEREFYLARRHGRHLCAMMIDIDHFKGVNDMYGHATGDAALQLLAGACRKGLRSTDLLGRYGGDELVALLPEADVEEALSAAARIREAVDRSELDVDGQRLKVTISVGVSSAEAAADLAQLLRRADRALYEAKQAGRNTTRSLIA